MSPKKPVGKIILPEGDPKPGEPIAVCVELAWGEDLPVAALDPECNARALDEMTLDLLARGFRVEPDRLGIFLCEESDPMVWISHYCFVGTLCAKGEA